MKLGRQDSSYYLTAIPMKPLPTHQLPLLPAVAGLRAEVANFPRFRYMGSKFRLLPWIHDTLASIDFDSATDALSGSGAVSCLLRVMGKQFPISSADFNSNENQSLVATL